MVVRVVLEGEVEAGYGATTNYTQIGAGGERIPDYNIICFRFADNSSRGNNLSRLRNRQAETLSRSNFLISETEFSTTERCISRLTPGYSPSPFATVCAIFTSRFSHQQAPRFDAAPQACFHFATRFPGMNIESAPERSCSVSTAFRIQSYHNQWF